MTFFGAFRIWWSFTWRTIVLTVPMMFVFVAVVVLFRLIPHGANPADPFNPEMMSSLFGTLVLMWFAAVIGAIVAQVLAMKWMLNAKKLKEGAPQVQSSTQETT